MAPRKSRGIRQARSVPRSPALEGAPFTEATPAGTATVVTDARFKLVKDQGIQSTSLEFQDKVVQIAEQLGTNPNFLMAVMSFETGGTFSPSVRNQGGKRRRRTHPVHAPDGASLGDQQRGSHEHVRRRPTRIRRATLPPVQGSAGDPRRYAHVLLTKAVGKGPDFVLFQKPSVAFNQNQGLDIHGDGRITVFDASSKVRQLLTAAGEGTGEIEARVLRLEVETLQDELIALGHLRPDDKAGGPGTFGPRTERALKDFQTANRLAPTGMLDAGAHAAIRQINDGVGRGQAGAVIAALQQRLVRLGNMTHAQVTAAAEFSTRTPRLHCSSSRSSTA